MGAKIRIVAPEAAFVQTVPSRRLRAVFRGIPDLSWEFVKVSSWKKRSLSYRDSASETRPERPLERGMSVGGSLSHSSQQWLERLRRFIRESQ